MNLLTSKTTEMIQRTVVRALERADHARAAALTPDVISTVHASIPDKKRVSFGIYSLIKLLGEHIFEQLSSHGADPLAAGGGLYDAVAPEDAPRVAGVALGVLSMYGLSAPEPVLPYFERAAASDDWMLREFAQGLVRRIIHGHPALMKARYLTLISSRDPNLRRYVSESLRPVAENRRFQKDPDYPLSILRGLFLESAPYPRTSVGNNLSDLARGNPELVYSLVKELVDTGDKNARWIATRACRNLVKKEPDRVMDLLGVDEYRYKKAIYRRGSG